MIHAPSITSPRNLADHLTRYLDAVLGEAPTFKSELAVSGNLPLYLAHTYRLLRGRLFGTDLVFALWIHGEPDATVSRLTADLKVLSEAVDRAPVVLVFSLLTSHARGRLIRAAVPFIVPHRQMYLPMLLTDLREYFPRSHPSSAPSLGWAAQFVFLRHILWRDVQGKSLSDVSRTCGYSAMTLTNVREELVAANLCAEVSRGRAKCLQFIDEPRVLWERALPRLRSPVRRAYPVVRVSPHVEVRTSGISALANDTMLSADALPTVAIAHREFRRAVDDGAVVECSSSDGAIQIVEAWMYDPRRLATSDVVDPLSLYLSLAGDPDDRVQIGLRDLLETVAW